MTALHRPFSVLRRLMIAAFVFIVFAVLPSAPTLMAASQIPHFFNYQGRLLDSAGTAVADGTYSMKFSLYTSASGGTPIYTSVGTTASPAALSVSVTSGLFSVLIGDPSSGQNPLDIDFNQDGIYLGVTINADSEMTPRKRLSSVPFAFNSETLQGNYASSSVTSTGGALFTIHQTAADGATANRIAFKIQTEGTSDANDYLMVGHNGTDDVFTLSRKGNVVASGTLAVGGDVTLGNSSADLLSILGRLNSDLVPSADVTYSLGTPGSRFLGLNVGSVTSTAVTTTALAFGSASGSSLVVAGQSVCLANGTNCPGGLTEAWTDNTTNNTLYPTTTTRDVLIGGSVSATANFVFDTAASATGGKLGINLGAAPSEALDVSGNIQNILHVGQGFTTVTANDVGLTPHGVYVSGRYAYVTNFIATGTLTILDVTNIQNPAIVGSVVVGGYPERVTVSGNYAYISIPNDGVFSIVNVSNPGMPFVVGTVTGLGSVSAIVVDGGYAYVTDIDFPVFYTIDVINPAAPRLVSTFPTQSDAFIAYGQGHYLFVANYGSSTLQIIDVGDPLHPVTVSSLSTGSSPESVYVEGRYAYLAEDVPTPQVEIVDVSNLASPSIVGTVSLSGAPYNVSVSGRYAYVANNGTNSLDIIDVASSTAPTIIKSVPAGSGPYDLSLSGRYAYVTNPAVNTLSMIDIGGTETNGLIAHSAELGSLQILTNANIANSLSVGGGLMVDNGGILSSGAIFVSTTNTTSTFVFSVSTTNAEVSGRLSVGGVSVCLANGINCPAGTTSLWAENTTNNTLYPTTTTRDVLLGGSTTDTAGFIFDRSLAGTSTVLIGATTNTNVLVGTSTYGGGLDSNFVLNGNDALVQGQLGSIGGLFSATGVTVGTQPTVYGDGFINKSNGSLEINVGTSLTLHASQSDITLDPGSLGRLYLGGSSLDTIAFTGTVSSNVLPSSDLAYVLGNSSARWLGIDALNATTTNATTTNLAFTSASGTSLTISGQSVCLSNGTNCPAGATALQLWVEDAANNTLYPTTTTRDLLLGGSTTNTAGFIFDRSQTGTSTVFIGATTNTNLFVGTSTYGGGLSSLFTIDGNDVFVQGNIGSATSVYSAGAFIAGSGTTFYGDGFINKTNGNLTISASGGFITPSVDLATSLGSSSLRYNGIFGSVTSTNATTTNLFFTSASGSSLYIGGYAVCVSGGANCPSNSLQSAYDNGNVATTTNARDVSFVVASSSAGFSSANFDINLQGTSTIPNDQNATGTTDITQRGVFRIRKDSNNILTVGTVSGTELFGSVYANSPISPALTGLASETGQADALTISGHYAYSNDTGANGLAIYDITDPRNPVRVSSNLGTQISNALNFQVVGKYLYAGGLASSNFYIIDISNPRTPTIVSATPCNTNCMVYVSGKYAYLADRGVGLVVYDVSDVYRPKKVFTMSPTFTWGSVIAGAGRYVYVGTECYNCIGPRGIVIYDISNPIRPIVAGEISVSTDQLNMVANGRYLYVGSDGASSQNIEIYDVSNPASPVTKSIINVTGNCSMRVDVQGKYLYAGGRACAGSVGRFSIYDVSSTTRPALLKEIQNTGYVQQIKVAGKYAYTKGGASGAGMAVWDLNGAEISAANIGTVSADDVFVNHDLDVSNNVRILGGLDVANGFQSEGDVGITSISSGTALTITQNNTATFGNPAALLSYSAVSSSGFLFSVSSSAYAATGLDGILREDVSGPTSTAFNFFTANASASSSATTTIFRIDGTGSLFTRGGINATGTIAAGTDVTVGGVSVCLSNGTNCPAGSSPVGAYVWADNSTNNTIYPSTTTRDVLLGGSTTATAGFILDSSLTGTSTVLIGATTNTNILVGTSTYGGGLDSNFVLNGNDMLIQGQLGSIGGLFSATGVHVGSAATYYADGFINATGSLSLNDQSGNRYMNFSYGGPSWGTMLKANDTGLHIQDSSGHALLDWYGNGGLAQFGAAASVVYFSQLISPSINNAFDIGGNGYAWHDVYASGTAYIGTDAKVAGKSVCLSDGTNCFGALPSGSTLTQTATTTLVSGSSPSSVFVSGRYAYVANRSNDTLGIFDLSHISAPVQIATTTFLAGVEPSSVVVSGRYAYVAFGAGVTFLGNSLYATVDISNPAAPVQVATTTRPGGGGLRQLAVAGRYLYSVNRTGFLLVQDISNPVAGTDVAILSNFTAPSALFVAGRYGYVLDQSNDSLATVDLSDPGAPVQTGTETFAAGASSTSVFVSGRYAYVTNHDINSLAVVDISNAASPVQVATTTFVSGANPSSVFVSGRYAYVTNKGNNTVATVDIAVPTAPVQVATTTLVSGASPSSVFVSGRYAAVANGGNNTLAMIDIKGLETNGMIAHSAEIGNLQVLTDAHVAQDFVVDGSMTVGTGGLRSEGAIGVYGYSTTSPMAVIQTYSSNTMAVMQVKGGCDNGAAATDLFLIGNSTDDRKFSVRCDGSVFADGAYTGTGADYAEYFVSAMNTTLMPGSVVVLDSASTSTVRLSMVAERNAVAGVVATRAGFIGNNREGRSSDPGYSLVSLMGQVPTRVSAINGAIAAGDALMAGDDGIAVKAKGPGMIIGRALDHLPSGSGVIDVFIQPMWWAGDLLMADVDGARMDQNVAMASSSLATVEIPNVDSMFFSFQGSAWDTGASRAVTSSFSLFTDTISVSSSLFTVANSSGTALLTISNLGNASVSGDLTVGKRLFLGSQTTGSGSTSTYIFVDDTLAPTSTYIATNADGWSTASTYDYAERYRSLETLIPGDLVVADSNGVNVVKRSTTATDVVLGIVSTKPGFITGAYATGTFPIALAGRVPTRVSTANGPIQAGDQLAPSSLPGVAVKAIGAGPVVGVALEHYADSAEGLISVFVKPGWKGGDIALTGTGAGSVVGPPAPSSASTPQRAGLAKIYAGATDVAVSFDPLNAYPLITVTPYGLPVGSWGVTQVTDRGFTLVLSQPASFDLTFAWKVEPSQTGDRIFASDNTSAEYDLTSGQLIGSLQLPTTTTAETASSTDTSASTTDSTTTSSDVTTATTTADMTTGTTATTSASSTTDTTGSTSSTSGS